MVKNTESRSIGREVAEERRHRTNVRLAIGTAIATGVIVPVLLVVIPKACSPDKPDIPVIEDKADIPVIKGPEGEIEHLSTPSGLRDAEISDVLQLDLAAHSLSIALPPDAFAVARGAQDSDPTCDEYSRSSQVCQVMWVDDCDEAPSKADLDKNPLNRVGCRYMNIKTVNREGDSVAGWLYEDGVYELNGYYVVEATGNENDIQTLNLRKVDAEVARQIDQ